MEEDPFEHPRKYLEKHAGHSQSHKSWFRETWNQWNEKIYWLQLDKEDELENQLNENARVPGHHHLTEKEIADKLLGLQRPKNEEEDLSLAIGIDDDGTIFIITNKRSDNLIKH